MKEKENELFENKINLISQYLLFLLKDLYAPGSPVNYLPEGVLKDLYKALLIKYLSVVDEVNRAKKPLRRDGRREYLEKLLTPLINLAKLGPAGKNPYSREFPAEYIWIDREIDTGKYKPDNQKYRINIEDSKPLDTREPNILISDKQREYLIHKRELEAKGIDILPDLEAGHVSLRKLHKEWLPALTKDRMKSKDLLDQLLICYTIKKALNGDKESTDKLCSLYERTAVGIAKKMAMKRGLIDDIEDIKQEARILLRRVISGYPPEYIINSLLNGERPEDIPLWIEKFYLYYLTEYLPQELDEILSGKKSPIFLLTILNPYTPFFVDTLWKGTPKRIMWFNKESFRPTKNGNLTAGLFGTRKAPFHGRFCQMLKDTVFKKYSKPKKEIQHDFLDESPENESEAERKIRRKVNDSCKGDKHSVDEEIFIKAIKKLVSDGISRRDAEIFLKNKLYDFNKTKLAKEYSLCRMMIYRICKELSSKYPPQ